MKFYSGLCIRSVVIKLVSVNCDFLLTVFAERTGGSEVSGRAIAHRHLGCKHFEAVEVEDCAKPKQR